MVTSARALDTATEVETDLQRRLADARRLDPQLLTSHEKRVRRELLAAGFTAEQVSEAYVQWAKSFEDIAQYLAERVTSIAYDAGLEAGIREQFQQLGHGVLSEVIVQWQRENPGVPYHGTEEGAAQWPAGLLDLLSRLEGTEANRASGATPIRSRDDLVTFLKSHFAQSDSEPGTPLVSGVSD